MHLCCGGSDAVVDPASSHLSELRRAFKFQRSPTPLRSSSFHPSSSSSGCSFLSALCTDSSLHKGNIMFVIYVRSISYEIWAFNLKGELIPGFSFSIDEDATSLPSYAGFGAVNSTLYMIGGSKAITTSDSLGAHVPTVDTHMIDFHVIPRLPNNSLPADHAQLGLVQPGPPLNARKLLPVVIVVGYKLYAFSRFVRLKESLPNFEVLDTSMEVRQWAVLPEPPFKVSLGIEDIDCGIELEVTSHALCEDHSCLIICVSSRKYHGLFKLHLQSRQWSIVSRGSVPCFYGEAVSLFKTYYALRYNHAHPENTVCSFVGTMAPRVEEVADMEPSPSIVHYHHQSQIGLMGDTLFVARIGYASYYNCPGHHLILDKFKVSIERGIAKATKFRRTTLKLEVNQGRSCGATLYCVPWESLPNFELLDTSMKVQQWAVLPEAPFKVSLGIEDVDHGIVLEIMSHALCEDDSCIIICVGGEKYHGIFKLDLQSHLWSLVSRGSIPCFYGGAVSLFKTYYALRYRSVHPENRVCSFVGTMAPRVEE